MGLMCRSLTTCSTSSSHPPHPKNTTPPPHLNRRTALHLAVLTSSSTLILAARPSPSLAEAAEPSTASPPPVKLKPFIGRDFIFQYDPSKYKLVEDPNDYIAPSTNVRRGQNPVRAEIASIDAPAKITVVQSQAAKLKQTFFQITDISQLGTPQEVISFLLPPTTRTLSSSVRTIEQPPKDTGTVMGVIQRDPVIIYRYEVILPTGQHAQVAVGALLGQVYLLGGSVREQDWERCRDDLTAVADSFRVLPR